MGFLDDLDSAFDNIVLGDDSADQEGQAAEPQNDMPFGIPAELQELKAAIAGENLLPVQALLANHKRIKRAYFLAALRGALMYVGAVEEQPERAHALAEMKAISDHYGQKETIKMAIQAGVNVVVFGNNVTDFDLLTADQTDMSGIV